MKRIYNPNKSRYKGIIPSSTLKRKVILNLLIFTICIIGIGYANLYTYLNINGNINIREFKDLNIKKTTSTDNTAFRSDTYKTNIKTITINDTISPPSNVIESWDISETGNGGVMAYIVQNQNDNTKYDLYIQGDGGIYTNQDSSYLFNGLTSLETINNLNILDTSKTTNMSYMFNDCSNLPILDLSNYDMSNVVDTTNMLNNMTSLMNIKTPKIYPIDNSITITLPDIFKESNNEYSTLDSTSPINTTLLSKNRQLVTFNLNGGTSNITQKIVSVGNDYGSLPTPTKEGYTFLGWESENNILPDDYQQVEYIESSGSNYIDSLYKPGPNTGVDSKYQLVNTSQQQRLFGMGDNTAYDGTFSYCYYTSGGDVFAWSYNDNNGTWLWSTYPTDLNIHRLYFNVESNIINIDDIYHSDLGATSANNTSPYTLPIFGHLNIGTQTISLYGTIKLYTFKIYESGVMVRNYVPCYKKSTNEVGLYEIEEGRFYTKANSTQDDFLKGNNINNYITEIYSTSIVQKSSNHTLNAKWVKNFKKDFTYVNYAQTLVIPKTGTYKIELWGAQGGASILDGAERENLGSACEIKQTGTCYGGRGAYTSGTINLNKNDTLYFYVGEKGGDAVINTIAPATFNGGGQGDYDYSDDEANGAGGGATDVRLVSGSWNNFSSLASRIMVAAGGGGASDIYTGLAGGGLQTLNYNIMNYTFPFATMTTQTSGYKFGIGQNGVTITINLPVAGGGGGYYGGTVVDTDDDGWRNIGVGGTSFISGHNGCNAISNTSTETNIIHTNQSEHYSHKKFTDTIMIDGLGCKWTNQLTSECLGQIQPNGTTASGHSGNGYARITFIG